MDDDDVCPSVLSAPVLWADNYNANQKGRTWPNPYRVRYRYRLQKTIAGKVCHSLAWSPWAAPRPLHPADIDSDGYVYNRNYYSPQMLIPDPYDAKCSFQLQRHFKGQPTPKDDDPGIACRVAGARQSRMLYLSDNAGP